MKELSSFKLLSHKNPDKLLFEHLKNTADISKKIVDEKVLNLDNIEKKILSDIAYIIGVSHDIGKATNFFQSYINEKDEKKKNLMKNKPETHHSFLSSLFTYYLVKYYISENSKTEIIFNYLPLISYFIVKRHHSNLHNAMDEVYFNEDREIVLKKQIENIDYNELQSYLKLTLEKNNILKIEIKSMAEMLLNNYKSDIFKNDKKIIRRNLGSNQDITLYFLAQFFYSVLINSDKSEVIIGKNNIAERKCIKSNIIDIYKEKTFNNKKYIDEIRDNIYCNVVNKINHISTDDKIFSLNVPTGTGKTLTSLSFALKLREKIKKEKGFIPRIIYCLPFLSIIEQNYTVFEDLFTKVEGKSPDTYLLLKHHHLSEIYYEAEGKEFAIDEAALLIEGWNSEIVVTTFWQFFHTLFSNKNSLIIKYHNLINSIIILDEVQAIPHKYWLLIKNSLKFLASKFNSYIILVTATQPLIFSKEEIIELVDKKEDYFKLLDRVNLNIKLNVISIEDFKDIIFNYLNKNPDKNILIVLNTIKSSILIYEFIKSLKLDNTELFYLSTNIVPKERIKRINYIKKKTKNRKIIVSTQLIEAGVDIDLDIVFRDFAPLDSINQISGRCNRNNIKKEKGNVYVFMIKDNKQELCKYVYDLFLILKTKEIFGQNKINIFNESQILEFNNKYFLELNKTISYDESIKNLKYLYNLQFEEIGKQFKLIEEDYFKIDIFIEIDEDAKKIWKKFNEIKNIKELFEKKKEFSKIKKDFYEYIISIDKKFSYDLIDEYYIGYLPYKEIDKYYDIETGFKRFDIKDGTLSI